MTASPFCTCEAFEPIGDPMCEWHAQTETATWPCTECGETLTGIAGQQGVCDYCGEWQDAPDGSGLRMMD